ncbi:der, partial [Symbiodinium sp. KB8]
DALTGIQFSADAASIVAGIFFISTLALIHRQWNFRCPAKQMLAWYGIVVLCYNIVSISSNPIVSGYVCEDYRKEDQSSPMVLAFGMLQHTASLIKLVLQWMLVCGSAQSVSNPTLPVFLLCVCMGLSLIPAFLATPNTLNEICGNKHDNPLELCLNVAWSYTRLSIALLLAGYGICKRRNKHKELSAETSSESDASDSAASELDQPNEQAWKCWGHLVPRGIITAITVLSIVKDMIQVVNAAEVHFKRAENAGSFAAMLLLESVLEHAQGVFLLAALFFDQSFSEMMLKFLPKVCPCFGLYQKRAATMMFTRAWSLGPQPDPSDLCDAPEDDDRRQTD